MPIARIAVLGSGSRRTVLPPHLADLANATTRPELYLSRLPGFAGTAYDRLVVDLGYVDAAQRAAAAGCAAIFINSYADYGIEAMRAAVSVPVVGAGEAAMLAAAADGRRYAIVTVWPRSMAFIYDERVRSVAGGDRCVSVRYLSPEAELARLGTDAGVQERMARLEDTIVERVAAECERTVREDGAQAIVLGCTCMAPIGPAVAARVSVPVIESARVGYLAAVAAIARPSDGNVRPLTQRPTLVTDLVDAALGVRVAAPASDEAECPVCIT